MLDIHCLFKLFLFKSRVLQLPIRVLHRCFCKALPYRRLLLFGHDLWIQDLLHQRTVEELGLLGFDFIILSVVAFILEAQRSHLVLSCAD